jgi:putative transcriptional regulator
MDSIKYNRIAEVLAEKAISQNWLAENLGVTKQTVSSWCNQKNQPSFVHLYRIADLLEIDVRELLVPNEGSPKKNVWL